MTFAIHRSFTLTHIGISLNSHGGGTINVRISNGGKVIHEINTMDTKFKKESVNADMSESDIINISIIDAGISAAGLKIYLIGTI